MKPFLKSIELNAMGHQVRLLHQVLSVFGLTVGQDEVSSARAGNDTLAKVRLLQRQLGIRVSDNAVLLDEDSITAIVEAMTTKGLLDTTHSFDVSGTVTNSDGSTRKLQRLIAFDLDLHQLRFLFARRPLITGQVLGIVYRVISMHLVKKACYSKRQPVLAR